MKISRIKSFVKWMSCLWFHITHPLANFVCGNNVWLRGLKINCRYWGGCNVFIGNDVSVRHVKVFSTGKNNKLIIHDGCKLRKLSCWMEGNCNVIEIGANTSVMGATHLAACDGSKIIIGQNCLFSHDIYIRTTDSHSIIDNLGRRINMEQDIIIGNHVWIGMQSLILKGSVIPDNCIVGARSTVTKTHIDNNTIIVGSPAKVIRHNINWKAERISQ